MKLKIRRKKFEAYAIIIFISLILIFSSCFVYKGVKNAEKEAYDILNSYSDANINSSEEYFSQLFNNLSSFGFSYLEELNKPNFEDNSLKALYKEVCDKNKLLAITLTEKDKLLKSEFFNSYGDSLNNLLSEEYINNKLLESNDKFITNSVYSEKLNGNINFVFQKINNADNEYVICGALPSREIKNSLNKSLYEGNGYSYILNADGSSAVYDKAFPEFKTKIDLTQAHSGLLKLLDTSDKEYYGVYEKEGQWYVITVLPAEYVNDKIDSVKENSIKVCLYLSLISLLALLSFLIYKEKTNKKIIHIAFTDEVTGYSNKQKFKIDIEEALKNNRLEKYAIAVLDIDNFKTFNGIFGFTEGDKVLKFVADTINSKLNSEEFFCRSNSDNFYMLIKYSSKQQIKERLADIMNTISNYKVPNNQNYKIICYCGVYKINPKNFERGANFLIDRARLALMRIIKNHRNGYAFYNDIFRNNIVFETELENDMEQALTDNDFKIFVQPKYDITNGTIAGGEALIRWQHKTKGFLTPDKFIELFERNCFITKLDYFVLTNICHKQKQWLDLGYKVVPISINQSRVNLFKKNYIDSILQAVKDSQVPPELIELEITEDMAFNNTEEVVEIINKLHEQGIKFSMDDFGSGYSSLNMLKNLDIDTIKLDKAFFETSSNDKKGQIIIKSAIDMADKLEIKSVAEGVETQKHVDFLKTTGCNIAQGYFYSKPIPIEEFEKLIKN